jgi:hypothetical protein
VRFAALGAELGHGEELVWLDQMLRWPLEWSGLHGIAEIKTPVVKIVTRTDATADKHVVRCLGELSSMPEQTASGLGFPHRAPRRLPLVTSRGFQRGLENPIREARAASAKKAVTSPVARTSAEDPLRAVAAEVGLARAIEVLEEQPRAVLRVLGG